MPILKGKPVLDPKVTCLGCDVCGDDEENHFYALGRNGKYYCCGCFFKVARGWKQPIEKLQRRTSGNDKG
jgi:hypothetical protein